MNKTQNNLIKLIYGLVFILPFHASELPESNFSSKLSELYDSMQTVEIASMVETMERIGNDQAGQLDFARNYKIAPRHRWIQVFKRIRDIQSQNKPNNLTFEMTAEELVPEMSDLFEDGPDPQDVDWRVVINLHNTIQEYQQQARLSPYSEHLVPIFNPEKFLTTKHFAIEQVETNLRVYEYNQNVLVQAEAVGAFGLADELEQADFAKTNQDIPDTANSQTLTTIQTEHLSSGSSASTGPSPKMDTLVTFSSDTMGESDILEAQEPAVSTNPKARKNALRKQRRKAAAAAGDSSNELNLDFSPVPNPSLGVAPMNIVFKDNIGAADRDRISGAMEYKFRYNCLLHFCRGFVILGERGIRIYDIDRVNRSTTAGLKLEYKESITDLSFDHKLYLTALKNWTENIQKHGQDLHAELRQFTKRYIINNEIFNENGEANLFNIDISADVIEFSLKDQYRHKRIRRITGFKMQSNRFINEVYALFVSPLINWGIVLNAIRAEEKDIRISFPNRVHDIIESLGNPYLRALEQITAFDQAHATPGGLLIAEYLKEIATEIDLTSPVILTEITFG